VTAADEDGRYRISGLLPGSFILHAQTEWHQDANPPMHAFFPGTPNRDSARIVELSGGTFFDRADIVIEIQSTGTITGRVVTPFKAMSGSDFQVSLLARNGSGVAFRSERTDRDAAFQFDDIPFGDYELLAMCGYEHEGADPKCKDGSSLYGRDSISVGARENKLELHVKPMLKFDYGVDVQGGSCKVIDTLTLDPLEEWPRAWKPRARQIGTRLEISPIAPGSYRLFLAEQGTTDCKLMGIRNTDQEAMRRIVHIEQSTDGKAGIIRIAVAATLNLHLIRLDPESRHYFVAVRSKGGAQSPSAIILAGAAGKHSLGPLVPGEYQIFAENNSKDTALSFVLDPGEHKTLSISLKDGAIQ
jgi:hypothetical protein